MSRDPAAEAEEGMELGGGIVSEPGDVRAEFERKVLDRSDGNVGGEPRRASPHRE